MARLLLASMLASTAAMNTGDTFTISFHSDADDACAQSLEYEFQMQMYVIQFAVTVMNADNGCLNLQSEYTLNSPGGGQPSSQGGQKYFVGSCVSNTPMSLQYTTEMCDGTPSSLYVTGQPLMDTYGDQTSRYTSLFGLVEGQGGSNIGTCQYFDMSLRPTPNAYYAKMTLLPATRPLQPGRISATDRHDHHRHHPPSHHSLLLAPAKPAPTASTSTPRRRAPQLCPLYKQGLQIHGDRRHRGRVIHPANHATAHTHRLRDW